MELRKQKVLSAVAGLPGELSLTSSINHHGDKQVRERETGRNFPSPSLWGLRCSDLGSLVTGHPEHSQGCPQDFCALQQMQQNLRVPSRPAWLEERKSPLSPLKASWPPAALAT